MKKPDSTVEFHFVTITPEDAKQRLATLDPRQRSLKSGLVDYLARQIANGEWNENTAEPIKISKNGAVLDGQHRLAAIAKVGVSVRCHVAVNVPEDTMGTLDTGMSRTPADQCKYLGLKNTSDVAACVRQILTLKARMACQPIQRGRISAGELQAAVALYGARIQDAIKAVPASSAVAAPRPVFRAVYVLACMDGLVQQAEDFFGQYVSGVGLYDGSPALALRRWMERRLSEGSQTGGGRNTLVAAVLIRAFNSYLSGKPLKKIAYKEDSTFPRFKSLAHINAAKTRASNGGQTLGNLRKA